MLITTTSRPLPKPASSARSLAPGSSFLFALFRGYLRRSRDSASASFPAALNFAGILSCAGFLIHSLVDFNLHIPANAALFFLMANLATAEILPHAPSAPAAAPHRAQLVPARIP